ncbi:MAG: protein kinase domain-containing protein [Phycisphaerales bacterium]
MTASPDTLRESSAIGDPAVRSAFGFDRDEAWLDAAARADAEPGLGRIGPYELVSEAGRGSQGRVYKAVQPGTGRTIAIKRLGAGRFATPGMRARFDREVRVLASLSHPGVVTVHGADEVDGQRFLLMEWIEGTPIDAWGRSRIVRERLEVFARVCDAVGHAHQRGVIHRDLKPSNVLVDATGRPRVLDFGLAKIREDEALEAGEAPATRTASFVGTPAYAAPEQLAGQPDTRTDVYALGAILYGLLTGDTPFDRGADLPTLFEAIRSAQPRPPSSRVPGVDADLDAITLKALAKEPERRYPSVEAFAEDVRRFLAGKPVRARPPSAAYRLRKFAARNRAGVAVGAAAAVALGAFTVYAVAQSRRYEQLAREEHHARVNAQTSEQEAVAGRQRADRETARAASVMEFLLETLAMADPDVAPVRDMSVRDMLDHAAVEAAASFEGQPETEAHVRAVMGRAYAAVGALREAEVELAHALRIQESLGNKDPESLYEITWPYAYVLVQLTESSWWDYWSRLEGLLVDAVRETSPPLADAIRAVRAAPEDDAPAVNGRIEALLGAAAATLGPDDPRWPYVGDALFLAGTATSHRRDALARLYFTAALDLQRKVLGQAHSRTFQTLESLIASQMRLKQFDETEGLIRGAVGLLKESLPAEHWFIALLEGRIGSCLLEQGRAADAAPLLQSSFERVVAAHGWTHRSHRETLARLARAHDAIGEPELARRARRDLAGALTRSSVYATAPLAEAAFGPEHAEFWKDVAALRAALSAGSPEAPALLDGVLAARPGRVADDDEFGALFADQLFRPLNEYVNRAGFSAATLAAFRELHRIARANPFLHVDKRANAAFWVSWNLDSLGEHAEGEALAREAVELGRERGARTFGAGGLASSLLGVHLLRQHRYDEAEKWILEGYHVLWDVLGTDDGNTRNAWSRVVELYVSCGRAEAIEPHLRRMLDSKPPMRALERWAWQVLVWPDLPAALYEIALESARGAFALSPENPYVVHTLGMALYRVGRFEEAIGFMRRADELRAEPANAETLAFQALALHALGDGDRARAARDSMITLIENGTDRPTARRMRAEVDRVFQPRP